jgi:hypothetical protein
MTAVTFDQRQADVAERLRSLARGPIEGWTTYLLTTLMAITVALSLDDAAWVLGNQTYGDFYLWAAILGTLVGFLGAKARWPRWASHLFGAIVAALVLPLFVGRILLPDGGSWLDLYRATATSVVSAWIDLAILNRTITTEIGHYILAISIIVWSVGQFAGYAVFGHRRPLDAVIVVGIVLIANMAMTPNDQLSLLVLFSVAALGVLARTHAFEEQTAWIRRHIGDATTVRSLYLRGGLIFIVLAVAGSLALTASASSAPLAGAWSGFGQKVVDVSQSIQRYLPFGGASRNLGFGFGKQAQITGLWSTTGSLALTIQVTPGEKEKPYWRAIAYDKFDLKGWGQSQTQTLDVKAGDAALEGTADDPTSLGKRREFTYSVNPAEYGGAYVLSPADPGTADKDLKVDVVGQDGYFASVQLANGSTSYSSVALLPVEGDVPGGRTENVLRAAGQNYPDEIRRLYTDVPAGTLGPDALDLLKSLEAEAKADVGDRPVTPFDLANTMERELRTFKYEVDVRSLDCATISVVECFARFKQGYCQYYASTMAMLMRASSLKVPTRLVEGFLPGTRDDRTGVEQIYADGAHAWVEVYFPGYGWQMFDPTGGGRAQTVALPSGAPVTPAPRTSGAAGFSLPPKENDNPQVRPGELPNGASGARGPSTALLAAIALVLLVAVGLLGFVAWRRGPRGEVSADSAWRSVARTAARFGFGPRPAQTVYEYAGTLGDVLPTARPELQTVARAKVEVAYGRRELGGDRLAALREAQRRLRVALLRLALRRRKGPRPIFRFRR